MSQRYHAPTSSHGRKVLPGQGRFPKPPTLHRRGHSYNHAFPQGSSHPSKSKPGTDGSKKVGAEVESKDGGDEDGMASFPQFCATCEKQIMTSGNSILYCSQACRTRDGSIPTPIQTLQSPSYMSSATSYFDFPSADIMPQRSPTVLRPMSLALSGLSVSESDSSSGDLQERHSGRDSEVAQYLAQFYSDSHTTELAAGQRLRMNRASTVTESGLPSLTHTPSSSIGTAASVASYRALPSSQEPLASDFSTRSANLVTPSFRTTAPSSPTQLMKDASVKSSASTLTSFHIAEASGMSFERRKTRWRHSDHASGTLKQLFSHEAMQAPPNDA